MLLNQNARCALCYSQKDEEMSDGGFFYFHNAWPADHNSFFNPFSMSTPLQYLDKLCICLLPSELSIHCSCCFLNYSEPEEITYDLKSIVLEEIGGRKVDKLHPRQSPG